MLKNKPLLDVIVSVKKNLFIFLSLKWMDLELITIKPLTSFCISVWLRPTNTNTTFEMPIFSTIVSKEDFNYYKN